MYNHPHILSYISSSFPILGSCTTGNVLPKQGQVRRGYGKGESATVMTLPACEKGSIGEVRAQGMTEVSVIALDVYYASPIFSSNCNLWTVTLCFAYDPYCMIKIWHGFHTRKRHWITLLVNVNGRKLRDCMWQRVVNKGIVLGHVRWGIKKAARAWLGDVLTFTHL
jgi:hypothetical protein